MTAAEKTIAQLETQGYTVSHPALWNGYQTAGTTSPMTGGKIRVHCGDTVRKRFGGYDHRLQKTIVMIKEG